MRFRKCIRKLFITASCISVLAAHTLAQTAVTSPLSRHNVMIPPASQSPTSQSTTGARRIWEERKDWGFFVSVEIGDTSINENLKELLASGLNINTKDRAGRAILHLAARQGQLELARYLLAHGADINAQDQEGRTPLMLSAGLGAFDIFTGDLAPWQRFWSDSLCAGAEAINLFPPLTDDLLTWYRIWQTQKPLLKFLLEVGANVNAIDHAGRTALDYAATGGLTDFDRILRPGGRTNLPASKDVVCELMSAQAPPLRGFHLGMPLREVAAHFRRLAVPKVDACGKTIFDLRAQSGAFRDFALHPEEFAGVNQIKLAFLDDQLAYIRVTYDEQTAPDNVAQYGARLAEALQLPGTWRAASLGSNWDHAHVIGCNGFKVIAGYYVGPYVEMHDTAALQKLLGRKVAELEKRRQDNREEQERRRRVFKP